MICKLSVSKFWNVIQKLRTRYPYTLKIAANRDRWETARWEMWNKIFVIHLRHNLRIGNSKTLRMHVIFIYLKIERRRERRQKWTRMEKVNVRRELEALNVETYKIVRSVCTHRALGTWSRRWRINRGPGPRRFCHPARCRRNLWSTGRRSRNKNRPTCSSLPIRKTRWLRPKCTWKVPPNDTIVRNRDSLSIDQRIC